MREGLTLLCYSERWAIVSSQKPALVKLLLRARVKVHKEFLTENLSTAAAQGQADIVSVLITHGANVNHDRAAALRKAVQDQRVDLVLAIMKGKPAMWWSERWSSQPFTCSGGIKSVRLQFADCQPTHGIWSSSGFHHWWRHQACRHIGSSHQHLASNCLGQRSSQYSYFSDTSCDGSWARCPLTTPSSTLDSRRLWRRSQWCTDKRCVWGTWLTADHRSSAE